MTTNLLNLRRIKSTNPNVSEALNLQFSGSENGVKWRWLSNKHVASSTECFSSTHRRHGYACDPTAPRRARWMHGVHGECCEMNNGAINTQEHDSCPTRRGVCRRTSSRLRLSARLCGPVQVRRHRGFIRIKKGFLTELDGLKRSDSAD